jgi:phosphatidylglycerophosphatase A
VPAAVLLSLWLPPWGFAVATALLSAIAIWTSDAAARVIGLKDPGSIVVDEAAGLFVTLLFLRPGPVTVSLAFVLFRLMDIVKPPPARRAEGLPGGWGIVVDDLIAGLYANVALRLLAALSLLRPGA